jgi:ribose-phosphate pyrophosphokinase
MSEQPLRLMCGTATPDLGRAIADYVRVGLSDIQIGAFADGETMIRVNSDVRGADVFVIQSTCPPVNDNLTQLLIIIDCLRRASAHRVTAVIPYFGYARQDRKDVGRVPITAKLVANLITVAGAHRVLTVDLHAAQLQGFFDIPLDHLFASPVLCEYFGELGLKDLVVVSPDVGGIKMARAYGKFLGASLAVVDKRRVSTSDVETGYVIGDVKGKNVLVIDDMISTAGTVCEAAKVLKEHGAKEIYVCATHPVLCGAARERLHSAPIKEVVVTDTIPVGPEWTTNGVRVLSVAKLLGEAILRIHSNESVSSLFGNWPGASHKK